MFHFLSLINFFLIVLLLTCETKSTVQNFRKLRVHNVNRNLFDFKSNDCKSALTKCKLSRSCEMALSDYGISCNQFLNNKTQTCSEDCRYAIITLIAISEGSSYFHCDCGENMYCRRIRNRSQVCYQMLGYINLGKSKLKPKTNSCKAAELICRQDEVCKQTLDLVNLHCQKAINGIECSKNCSNSFNILWSQKFSSNFKNCFCEKDDKEFNCKKRKLNIKRLCLNSKSSHKNQSTILFLLQLIVIMIQKL